MSNFGDFLKWYIDHLTDDEVKQALRAIAPKIGLKPATDEDDELNTMPATEQRNILMQLWRHRRGQAGVYISNHFMQFHTDASETIHPLRIQDIEQSLSMFVKQYGVRGTVFALVVGSSDYQRQIGFRLMAEHPPPKPSIQQEAKQQDTESKRPSGVPVVTDDVSREAVLEALTVAIDMLESHVGGLQTDDLHHNIERLQALHDRVRENQRQLVAIRRRLDERIQQLRRLGNEVHTYFDIDKLITRLPSADDALQLEHAIQLQEQLDPLHEALVTADKIRHEMPQASSFDKVEALFNQLGTLRTKINIIRDTVKTLPSISDVSGEEDTEQVEKHPAPDALDFPNQPAPDAEAANETAAATLLEREKQVQSKDGSVRVAFQAGQSMDTEVNGAPKEKVTEEKRSTAEPTKKDESGPDDAAAPSSPDASSAVTSTEIIALHHDPLPPPAPAEPEDTAETAPIALGDTAGTAYDSTDDSVTSATDPFVSEQNALANRYKNLLMDSITAGDYGTAYWLAREYEAMSEGELRTDGNEDDHTIEGIASSTVGAKQLIPSWALLAHTLGTQTDWSQSELVKLWRDVAYYHPKPFTELSDVPSLAQNLRGYLIGLSALRPTVFAPETAAIDWLYDVRDGLSDPTNVTRQLLDTVITFAQRGRPLDLNLLTGSGDMPWQVRLREIRHELEQWRDEMEASRSLYHVASSVSTHLSLSDGPLGPVFAGVQSEETTQAEARNLVVEHLGSRAQMTSTIERATRIVHSGPGKTPTIVGSARRHLLGRLERLQELLDDWVDVLRTRDTVGEDWLVAHVDHFRSRFLEQWNRFHDMFASIPDEPVNDLDDAFRRAAIQNLAAFAQLLAGPVDDTAVSPPISWEAMLRRPLLLLDAPPIDENGEPDLTIHWPRQSLLAECLEGQVGLENALETNLTRKRYFYASLIVDELIRAGEDAETLSERLHNDWNTARIDLKEQTANIRDLVEQNYIEHVLSEELKTQADAILLNIEETLSDVATPCNLDTHQEELTALDALITQTRTERVQTLRTSITKALADTELLPASKEFYQKAKQALKQHDIPVADEYISYAEQAQRGEDQFAFESLKHDNIGGVITNFADSIEPITNALEMAQAERAPEKVMQQLVEGRSIPGIPMNLVPGSRLKEVNRGLEAYFSLKRRPSPDPKRLSRDLNRLLEFIGFRVKNVSVEQRTRAAVHYRVNMDAGTLSPLAEFGSSRRGVYDIVTFYERPTATQMGEELRRYGILTNGPIIIYMGRMPPLQREEWSKYCWDHRITALLWDEVLFHFLAGQRETRLPAAVGCVYGIIGSENSAT